MKARDVMTAPAITLRPDTPVRAAAALLISHGFAAAPVVDTHRRVLGVVTEADLMRGLVVPDGWAVERVPDHPVAEVMTADVTTAGPDDDLADVVATMLDRGLRSVPVVDGGRVVGILSRRDVLRCVARGEMTAAEVRSRRMGPVDRDPPG